MRPPSMSGLPPRDDGAIVVVADSVRAQLYVSDEAQAPLRETGNLFNPESRMHERDLVADAGGRRNHRPTQGSGSAFGGDSAKAHYAEKFAARICAWLSGELDRHSMRRIYVVAEPQFLGLLRQRMDQRIVQRIAAEVPKAVTGQGAEVVRGLLPARL